ncbi:hypothetical protein MMC21_002254 [Puttea exsequens]|nr:hypothetical protein [Puttea exsequens]
MAASSMPVLALMGMIFSFCSQVVALSAPFLLERQAATIPNYVSTYAPLVWLYSGEKYFPSDIGAQLANTKPEVNFTLVDGYPTPLTLKNLDVLNNNGGKSVYLTSNDDITTRPTWLNGVKPDSAGKTDGATSAAIIVNDRGNGEVDAFYMYFYAFNFGGKFLGQDVDDHVGDWEHNMIRFQNGTPSQVWYSQHSFGEAFTYDCLEKNGVRPLTFSGNGSHANYAINGTHDHTIPNLNLPGTGFLTDYTDEGTLWDPLLSAYFYTYDANDNAYTAADASYPTAWLLFTGEWGDQQYPTSDSRQHEVIPGISATARYTGGPTGPEDKQLNRTQTQYAANLFFAVP